jgi:DNA repair protein RadA/Sms
LLHVIGKVGGLYISGEESAEQVKLRAQRLGINGKNIIILPETNVEAIRSAIESTEKLPLVIVDSIQTLSSDNLEGMAGSVGQIRYSAEQLVGLAKDKGIPMIIIGHVTKEGSIAGPKVLEHVVDTVLQLEGDRYGGFKILRSTKNRFGSTNEAGIFEMHNNGLLQVDNPSEALLAERQVTDGSVVLATLEGTRAILVEVQALVNKTSYGYPKRASSGVELNRLNLLVAMLERRTKLVLSDKDIYINIVGGIKISDPGADLAICLAIGSAAKGMKLKQNAVVFGEVGLSGEVRHVPFVDKRLSEAKKMGFKQAIGPKAQKTEKNTILKSVRDVRSALNDYLETEKTKQ